MVRNCLKIVSVVLLLVVGIACSQQPELAATATPIPEATAISNLEPTTATIDPTLPAEGSGDPAPEAEGYPAPEAETEREPGYPVSEPTEALSATIEEVPAPSSAEATTVTGILQVVQDEEIIPVPGIQLYLGKVVMLDDGRPGMSSLNKSIAPVTETNLVGQFIFEDVPPGQYTLVLDQITSTFLLQSPEGGDMIIEAEGGEIVDLGELQYGGLPVDLQR